MWFKQESLYHPGKFWCQARSQTWQPPYSAGTHKWEKLHNSTRRAQKTSTFLSVFPWRCRHSISSVTFYLARLAVLAGMTHAVCVRLKKRGRLMWLCSSLDINSCCYAFDAVTRKISAVWVCTDGWYEQNAQTHDKTIAHPLCRLQNGSSRVCFQTVFKLSIFEIVKQFGSGERSSQIPRILH